MAVDDPAPSFGCERCWPASADTAWAFRQALSCEADLIDESHFHVVIQACPACSQRFLSVFTETIDWADGEDPQYWVVLPLTAAEAAGLALRAGSIREEEIDALGPGRRCLLRDYPKGGEPSCGWGAGMAIRWHD